ncbi:redoxin domain-containing protein [Gemmata sp. JC717]|uniref:redoxin domain-containing protein n=1 Tax=Gemmata algarum TaxID=2975278 RepID=UPI0021BA7A9D|nr:redoxin domain-containing protein [Gemmata algarum]MDY3554925.1 redoxin domain-containing protein [Gemmata algarum]
MRSVGAGLIVAALLALAGCRSTDQKNADKGLTGLGAGRSKGDAKDGKDTKGGGTKTPPWLDEVSRTPGVLPKATQPTDPKDRNFNAKTASRESIAGYVYGPDGQPARNVPVRFKKLGEPADAGAPIDLVTNNEGYVSANGLRTGDSYELSVSVATQDGKTYAGAVQTVVPNAALRIELRDDLPPRADAAPPGATVPSAPARKPNDAWSPTGPTNSVPPTTISGGAAPATSGSAPPAGGVAEPDLFSPPSPSPRPVRPENVADDTKAPFRPPVTTIPNPNGPPPLAPLPKSPPAFIPSGSGARPVGGVGRTVGKFTLLDTLERPWESDSVRPGTVVLVEFATTSCVRCPQVVPVLKDLQARYGASGLQVMGVLCDEASQKDRAAAAARYVSDHNLNYAMYVEPVKAGSIHDQFDVQGYPHAVLLDSTGRTLWKGHPLKSAELETAIKRALDK